MGVVAKPASPGLRKKRQEDQKCKASMGSLSRSKASLDFVRLLLKAQKREITPKQIGGTTGHPDQMPASVAELGACRLQAGSDQVANSRPA